MSVFTMIRNRDESARYAASQAASTPHRWGAQFDSLPDEEVRKALCRLSELFHCYLGCSLRQSIKIGGRISKDVAAIQAMDAETLASWHAENLRLIEEVEAIPSLKRVF